MGARNRMDLRLWVIVAAVVVCLVSIDRGGVTTSVYLAAMVGASAFAWAGALRAPADRRTVPRLIAGSVSMTALGDLLWATFGRDDGLTVLTVADLPWAASYLLLGAVAWIALRSASRGDDDHFGAVLDVATVVVVGVLVLWATSIDGVMADVSVPLRARLLWVAFPLMDAVLLALVVRVLISSRFLGVSFGAGVVVLLAADTAYLQSSGPDSPALVYLAWLVTAVLLARSAWHLPPPPTASDDWSPRSSMPQVLIAIGPLLVPPALEIVADLRGQPDRPWFVLLGASVLTALAFVRVSRLFSSEQRAHSEAREARDAAIEASRAKTVFLSTMSHEIRTPLTRVLGAGEILESTHLSDFQRGLVSRIRRSGGVLSAQIDDVLDFSRIHAGEVEPVRTSFDLHDVVEDLTDVHRVRAAEAGVGFELLVDRGVPRTVVGDPGRLRQVLGKLLDNATKFTDQGQVSLEVRPSATVGDREAGGRVDGIDFVVTDTGIGICPEDLASVFEAFTQVDGSTTRRHGGTGLGLAICKELTELMGGSLTATTEVGAGSVFVARLPLAGAAGAVGGAPRQQVPSPAP